MLFLWPQDKHKHFFGLKTLQCSDSYQSIAPPMNLFFFCVITKHHHANWHPIILPLLIDELSNAAKSLSMLSTERNLP